MAENDETIEEPVSDTSGETPEVEEAPVSDTSAETPEVEETPAEVSDTTETPEPGETPAAEEVSDTTVPGTKPAKSLKHVPRSQRRTRTKPVREKPKTRKPITRTEKPESERGRRQERRGVVVSDTGDKTIVVKVDVIKSHPRYKKVIRSTVKFHAHDEGNTAGVGDTVRIVESRPLSKQKRWRLAEIVEKAK
jgi:small subunit ribosomal protein S17